MDFASPENAIELWFDDLVIPTRDAGLRQKDVLWIQLCAAKRRDAPHKPKLSNLGVTARKVGISKRRSQRKNWKRNYVCMRTWISTDIIIMSWISMLSHAAQQGRTISDRRANF